MSIFDIIVNARGRQEPQQTHLVAGESTGEVNSPARADRTVWRWGGPGPEWPGSVLL